MKTNVTPLVSIIVPVYNVEKYAKMCFESLIHQTLKEIEIILVDDGATDSSGEICDRYAKLDNRIKVIHQKNMGLGLSRNSGLTIATGKYVGFVDSDDCVSSEMFEALYNIAVKNDADISYCRWKKFAEESELGETNFNIRDVKVWRGDKQIHQYMLNRIGLPPQEINDNYYGASVCCGIFKKTILDKINANFVSERQFIAEDMLFDIDVIPNCSCIAHSDAELYFYRYNPQSLTTTYKKERFEKNVELYHEMSKRLKKLYSESECFDSLSRYFLTFTRIAIIQEVLHIKHNGLKHAYRRVKNICKCEELREIFSSYKIYKLPMKYRFFCILEKYNMYVFLIVLTYFFYRKKGKI